MRRAFALLERAAASSATVLLEGETGTGKEAAAESIHNESARKAGARIFESRLSPFHSGTMSVRGVRDLLPEQVAIAQDRGQDVVEVVGHAARQAADGVHLLGLPKLLRNVLLLRDVGGDAAQAVGLAGGVPQREHDREIMVRAVVLGGLLLERQGLAAAEDLLAVGAPFLRRLFGKDVEVRLPHHGAVTLMEQRLITTVDEEVAALQVLDEDDGRAVIEDVAHLAAVALHRLGHDVEGGD